MSNYSPIPSPPWELVQQWSDIKPMEDAVVQNWVKIATQAAQWGADRELEDCCEVLARELICDGKHVATDLRAVRRPKPPSLKEQALKMLRPLSSPVMLGTPEYRLYEPQAEIIRRALEALDD